MPKCNVEIRQKIKDAGLPFWFVADRLGIADTTFSKWLRKELSEEIKQDILNVIAQAKTEIQ
jgi:predicted XRE-type DNA-binding protein